MVSKDSSESYTLNKNTYVNLRWIGIIGQFITINTVSFVLNFEFNYILANIVVFFGALSNLALAYFYQNKNLLSEKSSFFFFIFRYFSIKFFIIFNRRYN